MRKSVILLCLATALIPLCLRAMDFACANDDGVVIYYEFGPDRSCVIVTDAEDINSYSGTVAIPPVVTHEDGFYAVTAIGDNAFMQCTDLTAVYIPGTVTSIGNGAFAECSALSTLTLPPGLKRIGAGAFNGCSSLQRLSIPPTVSYIGEGAFSACSALQRLVLPGSLTAVSAYLCAGCTSLTELTIPASVTSIGCFAFERCSALHSVVMKSTSPEDIEVDGSAFQGVPLESAILRVPRKHKLPYVWPRIWCGFCCIIGE